MADLVRPIAAPAFVPGSQVVAAVRRLARRAAGERDDPDALRPAAKLYLATLVLAAVGAGVVAFAAAGAAATDRVGLALGLAGLFTLTGFFPLPFLAGTKLQLGTAVLVAATLLLDPAAAIAVAALSTLLGQALRREPADQTCFNVAQAALMAAIGGGVLAAAGWRVGSLALDRTELLLAAAVGLALCLLNLLNVATIVALHGGRPVARVWAESLRSMTPVAAVTFPVQVAVGVLAAAMGGGPVWLLGPILVGGALWQGWVHLDGRRGGRRAVATP